jgi:hypothetical protein
MNTFELSSNLVTGQSIPKEYYGNQFGYAEQNLSPTLSWKNAPAGTKSFAITLFDEDAPTGSGFWHYLLVDIPAGVKEIDLGALTKAQLPKGSVELMTDAGRPGFLGPCTPQGREHNYRYTVHALKVETLGVPTPSTPGFVGFNLWANALGTASFTVKAGQKN